jgi:hypothetical protein
MDCGVFFWRSGVDFKGWLYEDEGVGGMSQTGAGVNRRRGLKSTSRIQN